jgi:dATP pyrophosphohydrolase
MPRAPYQVLVIPYRVVEYGNVEYALFQRADSGKWQGIAGGGEDEETPLQTARRESWEEAHIPTNSVFLPLQAMCMIPVISFAAKWPSLPSGETRYVVPEYAFGVDVAGGDIGISGEHGAWAWFSYAAAHAIVGYDSNRTALWELNQRLQGKGPRD